MNNPANPFDKGFSACYMERLIEFFDEDLNDMVRLPLHESQKGLSDNELQGQKFIANDEFILLDNDAIPADIRIDCVREVIAPNVVYQVIGRTSDSQIILSDKYPLSYAAQIYSRMQYLIKRSQSKWTISSQHLSSDVMNRLIEYVAKAQGSQQDHRAFPIEIYEVRDIWELPDSSKNSTIGVKLFHRPWLDEHLMKVVGFNSSQLLDRLLSKFDESFVSILMQAGQANVRCLEFSHFGQIVEGLPEYED